MRFNVGEREGEITKMINGVLRGVLCLLLLDQYICNVSQKGQFSASAFHLGSLRQCINSSLRDNNCIEVEFQRQRRTKNT
jgi:hypothetical protein